MSNLSTDPEREPTLADFHQLLGEIHRDLDRATAAIERSIASPAALAAAYDTGFGEAVAHCKELHAKGIPPRLWGDR